MPTVHRIGVILAAGRGRRMGRTKQLLPWRTDAGDKPLVAAAFDAIHPICDEMVVVLGHEADAVAGALADRHFHRVESEADQPMSTSVYAGILAARGIDLSATVVLQPGDHPEVAPATLRALIDCSLQRTTIAVIPEYAGRGGHPVLLPPNVIDRILASDCPEGLGKFWTSHPELCFRLAVDDAAILRDVDTPLDLTR